MRYMKQKSNKRVIAILMICLCLLAGCGSKKAETNIKLGIACVKSTQYESALGYFKAAEDAGENKMQIYRGYGLAYIGLSKYTEAIDAFEKALTYTTGTLTEYEYDINFYLASAFYKTGRYTEARDVYNAIIKMHPKDKKTYYLLGLTYLAGGDYDAAKENFDKCIALDKNDYSVYIDVYQSLKESGYEEEGVTYLKSVMDKETSGMSNYDKGRICYYLGDYGNSCVYLEQAYQVSTGEDVVLMLGRAYEADGNLNYAATLFMKYIQTNPGSAIVMNELGLCKLKQEDYEGALEAFQSAIAIPENGMMQTLAFNEIVAYEYLGEFRRAAVLMENYQASYPDDEIAQREYQFLKTR